MKKEWIFIVDNQEIKVVNTWLFGIKLYVNGELRDKDFSLFTWGNTAILSANIAGEHVVEVCPRPDLIALEIDAYIIPNVNSSISASSRHVFSSYRRLSLRQQRFVKHKV